jgi:transcriptional regulator with XRE-family HTH domain
MSINEEHERVCKAFGRVLKAARAVRGQSQEALSHAIGIDRSYESMLERGKQCPTLAMLLRIAKGIGERPTDLLADTLEQMEQEETSIPLVPGGNQDLSAM